MRALLGLYYMTDATINLPSGNNSRRTGVQEKTLRSAILQILMKRPRSIANRREARAWRRRQQNLRLIYHRYELPVNCFILLLR